MIRRTFGAHWLASLGILKIGDQAKLQKVAQEMAMVVGCGLFELACDPVNNMPAAATGRALIDGGIKETSYCRFFPGDESCGDPLGTGESFVQAIQTLKDDIRFIEGLRDTGLTVRHITGPCVFALGKKYDHLDREEIRSRILRFVTIMADDISGAKLQLNIEYLRPGEDQGVIGGIEEACLLLDRIKLPHVKLHGDTFHMLERGEVPHESILRAGSRLGYLHAHGSQRVVPGAFQLDDTGGMIDVVNWYLMGKALSHVKYAGPVVPEPFGAEIRAEIPELGEGLPPAINPQVYYRTAYNHLEKQGVLTL